MEPGWLKFGQVPSLEKTNKSFIIALAIILFLGVSIRFGSKTIGTGFPCACGTTDMVVREDRSEIDIAIYQYYQQYGEYPDVAESIPSEYISDKTFLINTPNVYNLNDKEIQKQGVYYKRTEDGYILKGYALAERKYLSFRFFTQKLISIELDTKDVFLDIDKKTNAHYANG